MDVFLNTKFKKCPQDTLTLLPKKVLINTFDKYSWILNKYFPTDIYKKNIYL